MERPDRDWERSDVGLRMGQIYWARTGQIGAGSGQIGTGTGRIGAKKLKGAE